MNRRSLGAGFTLIEVLVVLALVSILMSLAAPSLAAMVNSMRLTVAVNSLFSSLMLARSEAIKRGARVVVCKSASGTACITTGGWEQGWIVFHDANNNGKRDVGEVLLLQQQALPSSVRLSGNSPFVNYVSYTAIGTTSYVSGAFQAGTLTACSESATQGDARQIVISSAGRPRTVKTSVEHCP